MASVEFMYDVVPCLNRTLESILIDSAEWILESDTLDREMVEVFKEDVESAKAYLDWIRRFRESSGTWKLVDLLVFMATNKVESMDLDAM